jgi:hypothetical protein
MNRETIKYKPMFVPSSSENNSAAGLANLDKFLENEKTFNSNEPWSKLDKTAKMKKLIIFANKYKIEHDLSDEEHVFLINFFRDCLDKKKLQRVKDVNYSKETGEIKDIPALFFNKTNNHFTLKNIDKRVSTLKGLAPKKKQGTIKNIRLKDDSDVDSDEDEEKNF